MNGHTQTRFGGRKKKRLKTQSLTDYGEIDAAVAGRRSLEIDAALVESGVGFVDVVDRQASASYASSASGQRRSVITRLLMRQQFAEEGPFAQNVIVRPVAGPLGVLISGVVPAKQTNISNNAHMYIHQFHSNIFLANHRKNQIIII